MQLVDRISVVITAFDAERTIARAITSALSQPQVHEVIVVDDVSRDGTVDVAASLDDGTGRLHIIRSSINQGPAAARNAAFAAASSPFLAILDADDHFMPGRFVQMEDDGWDFLADNIAFIPEGSDVPDIAPSDTAPRRKRLGFEEFVERNISRPDEPRGELGFLKPVIRKASLDRYGLVYDERLRLGEDFILYATALARGARFELSERCGYVAEVRASSLSGRHRTDDLIHLAAADRALMKEVEKRFGAGNMLDLLRAHVESLHAKIATRRFLDQKREIGIIRAFLALAARPKHIFTTAQELVNSRLGSTSVELPAIRFLMQRAEFDAISAS